jgi:EpsI family protein
MQLLSGRQPKVLTVVLLAQAIVFYKLNRAEAVPIARPLSAFPAHVGQWILHRDGLADKEIIEALRADDLMNRTYTKPATGESANLFVAYFKSQRAGQAPHSPKNCLPGAGWAPSVSDVMALAVPGRAEPIKVNRYVVSRGEQTSVVLYWYQSRGRVIASEYRAKVFVVIDSVRHNRTDTALVRIVVPVGKGGEAAASGTAIEFAKTFFATLSSQLPS